MQFRRKICVVTGTRAEYGLLKGIMARIQESDFSELQIIVTGTHLVEEFGNTVRQIETDGFVVSKKIEMLLASDSAVSVSKSMALAQIGFAEVYEELSPDIILLLGDRYEILAAASAALISRRPLAHIHGGEVTEGAMDESIRHAITKMAHIHFSSTQEYRNRIIQMGENPDNVFHVGAPGLDHINNLSLLNLAELSASLDYTLDKPFAVVTYHPVTLPNQSNLETLNSLLDALGQFSNMQFIITYPNADTFGRQLIDRLKEFGAQNEHVLLVPSLGLLKYLSAVKNSKFVIGNSSSGIIEVPSLGRPSVNIGDRQKGRISAESVIHCGENIKSITAAIKEAISDDFQKQVSTVVNPYAKGNAADQIFQRLLKVDLENIIRKPFFDLPINRTAQEER